MTSKTLREFNETANVLGNSATRSWKEQGGRVMGYLCSAIPEEIFLDAVLPYANATEPRDPWRADFHARFAPLVKPLCCSTSESSRSSA